MKEIYYQENMSFTFLQYVLNEYLYKNFITSKIIDGEKISFSAVFCLLLLQACTWRKEHEGQRIKVHDDDICSGAITKNIMKQI
jgi:hypothetical protein